MEIKIKDDYVNLVPQLQDKEYQELKESISKYGFWPEYPTIVNKEGIVLDGNNRTKICQELGVQPAYVIKEFDSELEEKLFIMDNVRARRHLNLFQKVELELKRKP